MSANTLCRYNTELMEIWETDCLFSIELVWEWGTMVTMSVSKGNDKPEFKNVNKNLLQNHKGLSLAYTLSCVKF